MLMDDRPLTQKQKDFVEHYCTDCRGVGSEAFKKAYGYKGSGNQVYDKVHNPRIQAAIRARRDMRKAASWMTEDKVLDGLYKEATNQMGGNSSSRISAWVWIGKHLGMWKEKKEEMKESSLTINVANYGNTKEKEQEEEIEEEKKIKEISVLPNNIKLVKF